MQSLEDACEAAALAGEIVMLAPSVSLDGLRRARDALRDEAGLRQSAPLDLRLVLAPTPAAYREAHLASRQSA